LAANVLELKGVFTTISTTTSHYAAAVTVVVGGFPSDGLGTQTESSIPWSVMHSIYTLFLRLNSG